LTKHKITHPGGVDYIAVTYMRLKLFIILRTRYTELLIGYQLLKLASGRPERQVAAAKSLGKSLDPRARGPLFDVVAQWWRSENNIRPEVKDAALHALTGYRDPQSVEFFLGNLGSPDVGTAGPAADVLAAMKCRDAVAPLLSMLQQRSWGVGMPLAAHALVQLEAFELLADAARSGRINSDAVYCLLQACQIARNPACVEFLLPFLRSPDFCWRREAVETIASVDGESAQQGLTKILPDLDFEGLMLCIPVLKLSEEEGLNGALRPYYQIRRAFSDPSYTLDSDCAEKLRAILESPNETACVRAFAATQLGRLRRLSPGVEDGLDRLMQAVQTGKLSELDAEAKAAIPSLPSAVAESLIEGKGASSAAEVIQELERNGWRPRTPGETAVYHIVRNEWDQLATNGAACIRPLVAVAVYDPDDDTRHDAIWELVSAVQRLEKDLPEKTLHYLLCADLKSADEDANWLIKDRIWKELERRGLFMPKMIVGSTGLDPRLTEESGYLSSTTRIIGRMVR